MQYYIISYFLKKFTFINTEVEIAINVGKKLTVQGRICYNIYTSKGALSRRYPKRYFYNKVKRGDKLDHNAHFIFGDSAVLCVFQ